MDWQEYREKREDNYITFTLEGIGLPDFWVKIRKFGSYTSQELTELQQVWLKHRMNYIAQKVRSRLGQPKESGRDSLYDDVDDAMTLLEGEISSDDIPDERTRKILVYMTEEGAVAKLQPLVGIDIEVIKDWNLTDPGDNHRLPVPSKDMSVLEHVLLDVLWHIKEKLLEAQENVVPPKVRGMLSTPVS